MAGLNAILWILKFVITGWGISFCQIAGNVARWWVTSVLNAESGMTAGEEQ